MANILDILTRAQALRQETALNSITPDRAGGIMYDTLILINQMQLEGGSLLISKVYSSVAAMEADTTPTSDLTGRALRPGQLAVIVPSSSTSSDMGSVYRYNEPGSWTLCGKIGGLPMDTVPIQGSSNGITSGAVYNALSALRNEGYKYMGIATPGSGGTAPGTPNQPVFYVAAAGSYPNFGNLTVASGHLGFLKYSNASWTVESIEVGKDYDEEISQLQHEASELEDAVFVSSEFAETITDELTPTSYVNQNPIEDTTQVIPAGAKIVGVTLKSTGSGNAAGATSIFIYDENRQLIETHELGLILAEDTYFDLSSYNIIARDGYHYAFNRVGYKWYSSIPNGRFLFAATGNQADTRSYYGWWFKYEVKKTALDEAVEEINQEIVGLSTDLTDVNQKLIAKDKVSPTVTIYSGKYITASGRVDVSNRYAYSSPFPAKAGSIIYLKARGYSNILAMISEVIEDGVRYSPLVISNSEPEYEYIWKVEKNGNFAICYDEKLTPTFFVLDDSQIESLYSKIASIPEASFDGLYKGIAVVGVIGDSLACGVSYNPLDGQAHEYPAFAWYSALQRNSGMTYRRFARGGQTTRSFITDATYGLPATLSSDNKCNVYIIGLEVNDRSSLGHAYLGSVSDIDLTNPDNNADTYFGNYARIIQKITAFNSRAKFILLTNPRNDGEFNDAIRTISGMFSNCYLSDLYEMYSPYYLPGGVFFGLQDQSGHYPGTAYQAMSVLIARAIDKCIADNPGGFTDVQFAL